MQSESRAMQLGRRAFLQQGTLFLAATAAADASSLFAGEHESTLRIGMITDLHHADKPPAGTRYYRETLGKLEEAAQQFEQDTPKFLVELGDLIDAAELEWLDADLQATDKQVIVFAHQRLDVNNNHGVRNNAAVRKILEASGKVLAAFQGHSHKNDLKEIGGIHYCTLVAMVEGSGEENNGDSLLDILPDGAIRITGFRKQNKYLWEHPQ